MSNGPAFEYDVAISFLDVDETLARNLAQAMPSLSVFVYSERQAEIAGTDGIETLSRVYARDARIVVILYRETWGKTTWTRIEETAIKNRLYNDGPDFLTLIHLEKVKPTPDWFPAGRIWLDFDRFGIAGAASVIEERVRRAGGATRRPTPEENAARLEAELRAEGERLAFLHSERGVQAADASAAQLLNHAEQLAARTGIACVRLEQSPHMAMYRDGFSVEIHWSHPYANTLDPSELTIAEWKGRNDFGRYRYARTSQPQNLNSHAFDFDRLEETDFAWRKRPSREVFTSTRLAEYAVDLLLERIRAGRLG